MTTVEHVPSPLRPSMAHSHAYQSPRKGPGVSPRKRGGRPERSPFRPPPKRRLLQPPSPVRDLDQPISSDEDDAARLLPADLANLEAISDDEIQVHLMPSYSLRERFPTISAGESGVARIASSYFHLTCMPVNAPSLSSL